MALGKLSVTYESNGDPHCISTGAGVYARMDSEKAYALTMFKEEL